MRILNLGCGNKTSASPDVVNIDWSVYLVVKNSPVWSLLVRPWLSAERRAKFDALPGNIVVHNLSKGIPFGDGSADVVYHSHMLEHLDRPVAERFLLEVKRVLKPGGIQRIVVPDFEQICRRYLKHIEACDRDPAEIAWHDDYIAEAIEQSIRREAYGTSRQKPLRRFVENLLLGDARRRGETHQWAYDRVNLRAVLERTGYRNVQVANFDSSQIPGWAGYGLDINDAGGEYKPLSLYLEARK